MHDMARHRPCLQSYCDLRSQSVTSFSLISKSVVYLSYLPFNYQDSSFSFRKFPTAGYLPGSLSIAFSSMQHCGKLATRPVWASLAHAEFSWSLPSNPLNISTQKTMTSPSGGWPSILKSVQCCLHHCVQTYTHIHTICTQPPVKSLFHSNLPHSTQKKNLLSVSFPKRVCYNNE